MARSDTKLIQSVPITIGRHTFNIARMPAIVAVQVVEMYAALGVMFQDRPTNGRTYMLKVAKIVKYVLRNLILDEPSFVDRFRLRWAAFTTTKRKILHLPREQFNGLLDAITTVAFGDKKKRDRSTGQGVSRNDQAIGSAHSVGIRTIVCQLAAIFGTHPAKLWKEQTVEEIIWYWKKARRYDLERHGFTFKTDPDDPEDFDEAKARYERLKEMYN